MQFYMMLISYLEQKKFFLKFFETTDVCKIGELYMDVEGHRIWAGVRYDVLGNILKEILFEEWNEIEMKLNADFNKYDKGQMK